MAKFWKNPSCAFGFVLNLVLLTGCGSVLPQPKLPRLSRVIDAGGPLTVDWPEDARAALEAWTNDSILFVEFDGNKIVPVYDCEAAEGYKYQATSVDERVVRFEDREDLRVHLPLSKWGHGIELGAELGAGTGIEVALVTVGLLLADSENIDQIERLGPGCERATHAVRALTIGAFAMGRNMSSRISTVTDLFGIGQGSSGNRSIFEFAFSGDRESCWNPKRSPDAPPARCRAPLRLVLEPLKRQLSFSEIQVTGRSALNCWKKGWSEFGGQCAIRLSTETAAPVDDTFVPIDNGASPEERASLAHLHLGKCESGSHSSCVNYAMLTLHGLAAPEKEMLPLDVLASSCRQGYARACTHLAIAKLDGWGCEPSATEAAGLFAEGCEKSDLRACTHLGVIRYESPESAESGFALLSNSCEQGDWLACRQLASLYERDDTLPGRHLPTAISLFDRACLLGNAHSCTEAGYLLIEENEGATKNENAAVLYFEKACAGADPWGCWWLGSCYNQGIGHPIDLYRAGQVYKKACSLGHSPACAQYWFLTAEIKEGIAPH